MSKLMLIDATHPEETRVAVVSNGQIEDFDFEARDKRQLRGNIYLAKVTRVEPSLQAAFVDYGGNRHGFLAFSEIHPDYYQIPKEDREALLAQAMAEEEDEDDDDVIEAQAIDVADADVEGDEVSHDGEIEAGADGDGNEEVEAAAEADGEHEHEHDHAEAAMAEGHTHSQAEHVHAPLPPKVKEEEEDDDSEGDERTQRRRAAIFQKRYKIQEVIRRRQVILIQVVKEERGNKGAAVTTYLSLAGRYCVLMPNTARGGGISRKITNAADRKRLKAITGEFEIPRGAGLIVRTAGAKRTKQEISRDFEYLTQLWKQIVGRTMESIAPCLIHEEGHLVLRAVRDLYDKDVGQIIVEGDEAYTEARNFVTMLMPSHARKVIEHKGGPPLFVSAGVEDQLENIFSPVVQLPSGGYIVINQTEALVAIDVNSGKATRERNVETTALKTNLEAATEACRQMRLRDLAGLIVIDFIDMEEGKNNRAVEKRMKDALKIDRARVQTGRISQFGLFEISRQRRRAGVLELSSEPCKVCAGAGRIRSIESAALQLLRTIEARAADDRVDSVHVQAPPDVALYLLNEKRSTIASIEHTCHVIVRIEANQGMKAGEFGIEATSEGESVAYRPIKPIDYSKMVPPPADGEEEDENGIDDDTLDSHDEDEDEDDAAEVSAPRDDVDDQGNRRRGRRGGRRRGRSRDGREDRPAQPAAAVAGLEVIETRDDDHDNQERGPERSDGRRGRRRRGGRDRNRDQRPRVPDIATDGGEMLDAIASAPFLVEAASLVEAAGEDITQETVSEQASASPEPAFIVEAMESASALITAPPVVPPPIPAEPAAPERALPAAQASALQAEPDDELTRHPIHGDIAEPAPDDSKPRKLGWWSRRKAG